MNKNFFILVSAGILEEKHIKKIKNSIWVFLWFINKVTSENKGDGVVLYGNPIKYETISDALKLTKKKIQRDVQVLIKHNYIKRKAAGNNEGFVYTINNSKKFNNKNKKINQDDY